MDGREVVLGPSAWLETHAASETERYVMALPEIPSWLLRIQRGWFLGRPRLWGVALCVLSNCLTALGLVTQKMAHVQNEKSGKKMNYMKQPWWIAGG